MGTTRVPSLGGHCPASALLWTPPTPAPAHDRFRFWPYTARFASRPRCRDRSPELRSQSVTACHPVDPAGAPRHRGLLHGRGGFSFRQMHKGSASGLFSIEAHLGSLVLRPAASPPPRLVGRRLNPANLNVAVAPPPPRRALHAEQAIGVEGSFHPSRSRAPWLGIRACQFCEMRCGQRESQRPLRRRRYSSNNPSSYFQNWPGRLKRN